jgi:hypothetical protein
VDYANNKMALQVANTNTVLFVSSAYTSSDSGFGRTKFNTINDAVNSIKDSSINKQYTVRLMDAGTHNEWETIWAGDHTGTYLGIIPANNTYVTIESGDINHPENYVLKWDGLAGFAAGTVLTQAQAMQRALFHLTNRNLHVTIQGFTLQGKNLRYLVHPESAGSGNSSVWLVQNCVIDWQGSDGVSGWVGTGIGIGISAGENGTIRNCKLTTHPDNAIIGHNNGWSTDVQYGNGAKPFVTPGAKLTIENCDLNGHSITQYTTSNDADTFDELTIKNCKRVNQVSIGAPASGKTNSWKVKTEFSDITTISV